MTHYEKVTKAQLHQHLSGLLFPTSKNKALEYLRNKGVPPGIITLFGNLPEREFRHEVDLLKGIGVWARQTRYNLRIASEITIPHEFRQFEDKPTLIIVTGKQEAILYRAYRGSMVQIDAHKIPKPHYSDREGNVKLRSRRGAVKSGGARELHDERSTIRQFLHDLKDLLKRNVRNVGYSEMYLLVPSQVRPVITEVLKELLTKERIRVIEGNYLKHEPRQILEVIDVREAPAIPTKREAQKIINKSRQAEAVIRS